MSSPLFDPSMHAQIGELRGTISSLIRTLEDDRNERVALRLAVEALTRDVALLAQTSARAEDQVTAQGVKIAEMEKTVGLVRAVSSHSLGILSLLSGFFGLLFSGIWWVMMHFGEITTAFGGHK